MGENKEKNYIKTTLYMNRKLHDEAKLMAVYTHTSMSHIMCISLREKIEQLKREINVKKSN